MLGETDPCICVLAEPLPAAEDGGGIPEACVMLCL